ncbi:phosphotransferase [Sphingomonas sp. SRS2]|uniref:phosphotransferase n=1 Tax=Sphingomonas sp. SRS2 TaxID=133190 RepID=UPI0006184C45|nr:phosphotransferase [Sphingomonas sp. SRS2]KKC26113.1 hypothetical protein WP12_10665 [Sphingomonas sp. SRS2]
MHGAFEASPPMVSESDAEGFAYKVFGVKGRAKMLSSERDANFRLLSDRDSFLLKFINSGEDPETNRFQTDLLKHLSASATELPVSRLCPDLTGGIQTHVTLSNGVVHAVRLMTFLPGTSGHDVVRGPGSRHRLATVLAALDICLADFSQRPTGQPLLWDVSRAEHAAGLLEAIGDDEKRGQAAGIFDHWRANIAPGLPALRHQVIHNDLNLHNYLVDQAGAISGVIDFGDAVFAPLVADLATAASYQILDADDPIGALAEMAATYCRILPLLDDEIDLLWGLCAARWAITMSITNWRAGHHPANRSYILRNEPLSVRGLALFHAIEPDSVADRVRAICRRVAA